MSLALTCSRLHAIATPIMYRNKSFVFEPRRVTLFSSIEEDASCLQHVENVSGLLCDGTAQLCGYISLPNAQCVTVELWDGSEPIPTISKSNHGCSNVTILRFSDCGASVEDLTDLLRCTRALQELAIESNQDGWQQGHGPPKFDTAAIVRACSVQASTLQTLILTHTEPMESPSLLRYGEVLCSLPYYDT